MAFFGSKILPFPLQNMGMINILKSGQKGDELQTSLAPLAEAGKEHFKDYDANTEKEILIAILETYRKEIPGSLPDIYNEIDKTYKGDVRKYVNKLFKKSVLVDEDRYFAFLKNPKLKKLEKDPASKLTNSFYNLYKTQSNAVGAAQEKLNKAERLFVDGLRKANPDKVYYPDANSTLRLSFGQVLDYFPADAVHYDYVTYADGILEKEDPKNEEFIVPVKLKELIQSKNFGKWHDKEGRLPVCFISNNDITGGNSGSPVLNNNGELIGIAFDGNWEAMSGDIAFEPALQRTISVDIRYVLFIIDKYANADRLIQELSFAESNY
jgi:hypothetical protein